MVADEGLPVSIQDDMIRHFAIEERFRADRVAEWMGELSIRERELVHEIAVMAFHQGAEYAGGRGGTEYPRDEAVAPNVVDACFAFPDLYPTVNRVLATVDRRRRMRKQIPT